MELGISPVIFEKVEKDFTFLGTGIFPQIFLLDRKLIRKYSEDSQIDEDDFS